MIMKRPCFCLASLWSQSSNRTPKSRCGGPGQLPPLSPCLALRGLLLWQLSETEKCKLRELPKLRSGAVSPPSRELEWMPRDLEDRGGRAEITGAGLTTEEGMAMTVSRREHRIWS